MTKESVLIIGSSSFAGASMVDFLISKKKYNVYGTYRRKKNKAYLPYFKNSQKIDETEPHDWDKSKNSRF